MQGRDVVTLAPYRAAKWEEPLQTAMAKEVKVTSIFPPWTSQLDPHSGHLQSLDGHETDHLSHYYKGLGTPLQNTQFFKKSRSRPAWVHKNPVASAPYGAAHAFYIVKEKRA